MSLLLSDEEYAKIKVLVAFSNKQLGEFLKSFFRGKNAAGFQVIDDATLGREVLELGNFNLMLVDYDLKRNPYDPGFIASGGEAVSSGGVELVRALRGFAGFRSEMPVMLLMGNPSKARIFQVRDAGVNEIISLPLTANLIEQRLAHIYRNPKPFIRVPTYTGPCRRRERPQIWSGENRRRRALGGGLQKVEF